MQKENDVKLVQTGNSLSDLIEWSKQGHIIMLSKKGTTGRYFSRPECMNANYVIQIILSNRWHDLMHDDEWPWYIIQSGCIEFSDDDVDAIGKRLCEYKPFYLE